MKYIIKTNNIFKSVPFIWWLSTVSTVLFYNYLYLFSFSPISEGWFTVFTFPNIPILYMLANNLLIAGWL